MIEYVWTVLCSRCIVESQTDVISLIDLVEQATLSVSLWEKARGAAQIKWTMVTQWRRNPYEQPCKGLARVELLTIPSLKPAYSRAIEYEVDLTTGVRLRAVGTLEEFPHQEGSGDYEFRISIKDQSEQ